MIAHRVLAVIAAVLLVLAVAIATFGTESISLGQALCMLDQNMLDRLPDWTTRTFGPWSWTVIVEPLLVRPAWLIPASVGIVCVGLSMSLSSKKSSHRSHRRS